MLPLITKLSDHTTVILILMIRLYKISDSPTNVREEHITEANNFILNILFWNFLRQTNKIMLI